MNKKYYLPLLALLVATGCSKVAPTSDTESMNLKGHVKQMTEFVMDIESIGMDEDTTEQKERTDYDVARVFDFDTHGRITNIRIIAKDGNFSQKFNYDKDSVLQSIDCFKDTYLVTVKTYKYNSRGLVSSISTVNSKTGKEEGSRHFYYDSKGKIEKEVVKNDQEEVINTIKNTYDNNGMLSKSINYTINSEKGTVRKLTYDQKGNIELTETVDEMFGDNGIPYQYKYKSFDEKDNWTSRLGISMGMPIEFLERSYEYYE